MVNSKNPLEGITLEMMLNQMVDHYGWDQLASEIRINCFARDPSVKSSLKFLRRTPWARNKVEALYLMYLREKEMTPAEVKSDDLNPGDQKRGVE
jgi:uncharacterized protein (DUF2132 family)